MSDSEDSDISEIYTKLEEKDKNDLVLLNTLINSGMYNKKAYEELYNSVKGTNLEDEIKNLESSLKDFDNTSTEDILDINNGIFNSEILNKILSRIENLEDKKIKKDMCKKLHRKIFYMIANDEIDDHESMYMSSIMLMNFYR